MKGIKFRSYNAATARLAELAGMLPVQIEAAELSQALATGVADSFISSGSTGYDKKVWEQLSYFYDVKAWLPRNYVFVNKDAWNDLDESTQNIVMALASMAELAGTARAEQLTDWYVGQLAANGMTIVEAKGKLLSDLQAIGATMSSEWMENAGAEGKTIIDAYKAMN